LLFRELPFCLTLYILSVSSTTKWSWI